jgi:putative oxidoreductase
VADSIKTDIVTENRRRKMNGERLNSLAPKMLSVLRIMTGLIFLAHGTQKFLGFPAGERAGSGLALANPGAYAGIAEIVAGTLITLGLFTRQAAFIASGTMAGAYWIAHAPKNFFPVNNGGDAAILYCFVFLYLVFAGPGPWSLDAARAVHRLPSE